jgi:hypothetical protein
MRVARDAALALIVAGAVAAGCLGAGPPKTPNQRAVERAHPRVAPPPPPDAHRRPRPAPAETPSR